jgi:hypothetical protein
MPFKSTGATGLAILLLAAGCAKSPLSPTISTPQALTPTTNTLIPNSAQPVTLVAQNALGTSSGAITYTFEVATDSAFANKVQTKSGVAEGAGGQTSATLTALPANADYYWHVQATAGGTTGLFSAASKFTIGPAVSLGAPGLISPANGSTASTQPTLTVSNASHSGSVGAIAYRFDISTSSTFATIAFTGTAAEGSGQTSFVVGTALAVSTTFYWRATAIDTTNIATGPASATGTFTTAAFSGAAANLATQLGLVLWPGVVPGGVNGHAVMGTNCNGDGNWGGTTCFSPLNGGFNFPSPTLEALQYFDLFDRGYDPQSAINWLKANGYSTDAEWYPPPDKAVLGLGPMYLAARDLYLGPGAIWDIVVGLG